VQVARSCRQKEEVDDSQGSLYFSVVLYFYVYYHLSSDCLHGWQFEIIVQETDQFQVITAAILCCQLAMSDEKVNQDCREVHVAQCGHHRRTKATTERTHPWSSVNTLLI
jgi:hypothetical protein